MRHFLSGAHPEWFYIANSTHATTSKISELISLIGETIKNKPEGVSIVNIVGTSGSGKTTAIRAALYDLVKTYPYIYEYDSPNGIDINLLLQIINGFTSTSIIVFYSAAEYYYAVNAIAVRLKETKCPLCLFVLEDRLSDYKRNLRQLEDCVDVSSPFEMGHLSLNDAIAIVEKIETHGLNFEKFSEFPINKRAGIILDKERGFGGDLLTALYSLTTHENLEQKIYQDYHSVTNSLARQVLDVAAIMNSLGLYSPIKYVAGFLKVNVDQIIECLNADLLGIVLCQPGSMRLNCRHRVIANYYFENCIAGHGKIDFIVSILEYLSTQFSIDDIKHHPIAYLMYKNIISSNFLFGKFFPEASRKEDTGMTYHEAQKFYSRDGVFWLHFGRYYKKIGELDNAIDCFRTGLTHYNSFQTRHSLGAALLEKYAESSCDEQSLFDEGTCILEAERITRGSSDAYPTTAMCDSLLKIISIKPQHKEALKYLKESINFGLQHFKDDEYFGRKLKEYVALQK